MDLLLIISILLGITALFGVVNDRYLGLQSSIGLMLLALLSATPVLDANRNHLTSLLTWGGLRGGLALALALSLPQSPEKMLLLNMTFGVVVFSILVQGSTIGKLFKPAYLNSILK